jgi:hypothetical protein
MSHQEKNQAAKAKMKQAELANKQNPQNKQQQPGNRPQDNKGSAREDSASQWRANENDRSYDR